MALLGRASPFQSSGSNVPLDCPLIYEELSCDFTNEVARGISTENLLNLVSGRYPTDALFRPINRSFGSGRDHSQHVRDPFPLVSEVRISAQYLMEPNRHVAYVVPVFNGVVALELVHQPSSQNLQATSASSSPVMRASPS